MFDRLPARREKATTLEVPDGFSFYEVPWSVWFDFDGFGFFDASFCADRDYSQTPHGTLDMKVTRVGIYVDIDLSRSKYMYNREVYRVPGDMDYPVRRIES